VPPRPAPALDEVPLETRWPEVWAAALALGQRLAVPEPGYRVAARPVRMEEKIDHVLLVLAGSARVEFRALVAPWGTRMHAVMSLLACLELSKRHRLGCGRASPSRRSGCTGGGRRPMRPSRMIEAVLFASEAPLPAADLARVDDALDEEQVEALLAELRLEYDREGGPSASSRSGAATSC
jgi:hypothetical protein